MAQTILSESEFEAFRNGDQELFEKVYKMFARELYVYCYKGLGEAAEAEDIVAETLANLWSRRQKIKNPKHLQRFLYLVAHNKCVDHLRKRKTRRTSHTIQQLSDVLPSGDADLYDRLDAAVTASLLEHIQEEIKELAPGRRMVMYLNVVKDLAMDEVADLLHITRKTAYNHRSLAITEIRKALRKKVIKGISFKDLL